MSSEPESRYTTGVREGKLYVLDTQTLTAEGFCAAVSRPFTTQDQADEACSRWNNPILFEDDCNKPGLNMLAEQSKAGQMRAQIGEFCETVSASAVYPNDPATEAPYLDLLHVVRHAGSACNNMKKLWRGDVYAEKKKEETLRSLEAAIFFAGKTNSSLLGSPHGIICNDFVPSIVYPLLGLFGEVGELAEKLLPFVGGETSNDRASMDAFRDEACDCVWYLQRIAECLGTDIVGLMAANTKKIRARMESGNLKGSGDSR